MGTPDRRAPPFLGASASWVDDEEATYEHTKREVSEYLRQRLMARADLLSRVDVSTEQVTIELRRQMAECAVDGNLMLSTELGEATWELLRFREGSRSL